MPYAFDGARHLHGVGRGDEVTIPFVLVRVQAKLEAPLIGAARASGGAVVISTLADVTFYGRDQTGREVVGHRHDQRQLRRLGRSGELGRRAVSSSNEITSLRRRLSEPRAHRAVGYADHTRTHE